MLLWPGQVWAGQWWLLQFHSGRLLIHRTHLLLGLKKERESVSVSMYRQKRCNNRTCENIFSTWNVSGHIKRGCRTEPFGGGCTYRELVRDTWVKHGEQVMGGVWGQRRCESRPLERHRRVKWTDAAVADLRLDRDTESWFIHLFPQSAVKVWLLQQWLSFCFC